MKKSLILIVALGMPFNNALAYTVSHVCTYNGYAPKPIICPANTAMAGRAAYLGDVNCTYNYKDPTNANIDRHVEHIFFMTRCLPLPDGSAPQDGPSCIKAVGCDGKPGHVPTAPVLDTNGNVAVPAH